MKYLLFKNAVEFKIIEFKSKFVSKNVPNFKKLETFKKHVAFISTESFCWY